MIEDAYVGHNTPILADVIYCAIADFRAGSYERDTLGGLLSRG